MCSTEGGGHLIGIIQVSGHRLDPVGQRPVEVADQASHPDSGARQLTDQFRADIAGRPRDEDQPAAPPASRAT